MNGLFITFEGPEGSGKSTQIRRLATTLRKNGLQSLITREPGGTLLGEKIRKILLQKTREGIDPRSELFLYLASRSQHIRQLILPALKKGTIVLCDRFSDSTRVYQGKGRGLDRGFVDAAVKFSSHPLNPHLTFLLDLDVKEGLSRVKKRGRSNRFDKESLLFHNRVRKGFLELARKEPRRIFRIDAGGDRDRVQEEIWKRVQRKLAKRKPGKKTGSSVDGS